MSHDDAHAGARFLVRCPPTRLASDVGHGAREPRRSPTGPAPCLPPRCVRPLPFWTSDASAFCGFYVAKADSKLFNKASEVAIARAEDKTVITMANDFKGDVKEFALVVPVPTVLEKAQIHVGDAAVLKHLADYSAPRLVEYFDANPCRCSTPKAGPWT